MLASLVNHVLVILLVSFCKRYTYRHNNLEINHLVFVAYYKKRRLFGFLYENWKKKKQKIDLCLDLICKIYGYVYFKIVTLHDQI